MWVGGSRWRAAAPWSPSQRGGYSDESPAITAAEFRAIAEIERSIVDGRASAKAAGVLMGDEALVRRDLELGSTFIAVGADTVLLSQAVGRQAAEFAPAEVPLRARHSGPGRP